MDHAENHVSTSTVIIAGYEDEVGSLFVRRAVRVFKIDVVSPWQVRDLMAVNAGFGSRFPPEGWFNFKDYTEVQVSRRPSHTYLRSA